MGNKLKGSWERPRGDDVYATEGIAELRSEVYYALCRKYGGLAETMFAYDMEDEALQACIEMSWGTVPEVPLYLHGQIEGFRDDMTGDIQMLPWVQNSDGLNIYGRPVSWHPVPVGWVAGKEQEYRQNGVFARYMDMRHDLGNSVIWKNDNFGKSDKDFVETLCKELVENVLTMNQLQLLARSPICFDVGEDNVLSAKQYFLSIAKGLPVIFTNKYGDDISPKTVDTHVQIDPSLFDIFDRFECLILEQLGYPCVPISKRAQQSVSEVQSNDDKVRNRRMEKLRQREMACDRMNRLFGLHMRVRSVIDEQEQKQQEEQMQQKQEAEGNDD